MSRSNTNLKQTIRKVSTLLVGTETSLCQRQIQVFWGLKFVQVVYIYNKKRAKLEMEILPHCIGGTLVDGKP